MSGGGATHVIACKAPYGAGGLGQHVAQVIEEARAAGTLDRYYVVAPRPGDAHGVPVNLARFRAVVRRTPLWWHRGWRERLVTDAFDRAVAAALTPGLGTFVGFSGQALQSFRRARTLGARHLALHSPTVHLAVAARQYAEAVRRHGIERSWVSPALVRKAEAEYALADVVYVNSEYGRASFLAEGVPAEKLRRYHLTLDPRFRPGPRPEDGVFRVVYVGGLSVAKGVPVLLDAFAGLRDPTAELTLLGSWGTRGMRRYLERACASDPRIRLVAAGDPLPHLQRADVYVHPSYQDGYGYAPMEALACGVPVIVTEDTGMKEAVREGVNGFVVPTGDPSAILARLDHLRAAAPRF